MISHTQAYRLYLEKKAEISFLECDLNDKEALLLQKEQELDTLLCKSSMSQIDIDGLTGNTLTDIVSKIYEDYHNELQKQYDELLLTKITYDEFMYFIQILNGQIPKLRAKIESEKRTTELLRAQFLDIYHGPDFEAEYMDKERQQYYRLQKEVIHAINSISHLLHTIHTVRVRYCQAKIMNADSVSLSDSIFHDLIKYKDLEEVQKYLYEIRLASDMMNHGLNEIREIMNSYINRYNPMPRFYDNLSFHDIIIKWDIQKTLEENLNILIQYQQKIKIALEVLNDRKSEIDRKIEQLTLYN